MALTENAKKYHERMFPGYESEAIKKDPEFIEQFDNFAYDEVVNQPGQELPDKTRWMAISQLLSAVRESSCMKGSFRQR